jgi:hypothetical protein
VFNRITFTHSNNRPRSLTAIMHGACKAVRVFFQGIRLIFADHGPGCCCAKDR